MSVLKWHLRRPTMTEQHALDFSSILFLAFNLCLGIFDKDSINLIAAAFGVIAMTAANIVKIIIAFQELRELARNKWRKIKPNTRKPDNDEENS